MPRMAAAEVKRPTPAKSTSKAVNPASAIRSDPPAARSPSVVPSVKRLTPRSILNSITKKSTSKSQVLLQLARLAGIRKEPRPSKEELEEEQEDKAEAEAEAPKEMTREEEERLLTQLDLSDELNEEDYAERGDGLEEEEIEIRKVARYVGEDAPVPSGPVFYARDDPAAADAPTAKFFALCVTRRDGDFVYLFDARPENIPTLQLFAKKLDQLAPEVDDDGDDELVWEDAEAEKAEVQAEKEEASVLPTTASTASSPSVASLLSDNVTHSRWLHPPAVESAVDFESACAWADAEARGYAKVVVNCELDHAAITARLAARANDPTVVDREILPTIAQWLKRDSPVHQPAFAPARPHARYHVEYHNHLDTGNRVHLIEAREENLAVVQRLLKAMQIHRADPDYQCGWMTTPDKPMTEAEARREMIANGLGELTTFDILHGVFDAAAVRQRLMKMTRDEDSQEDEAVPFVLLEKRLWFKAD